MDGYHQMIVAEMLANLPQPQLPAPAPASSQAQALAPDPAQPPARAPHVPLDRAPCQPSAADPAQIPAKALTLVTTLATASTLATAPAPAPAFSSGNRVPEILMHKNRLQEYTQRSSIPLPEYQCHNEGFQHAPKFRASVFVDGVTYTSPNSFSHRKAAEQDVAKIALECISQKIKDEGIPLINEDTVFCKSILNEFAVKMNLEMPVYTTRQSEALLPIFVSSLVFNGNSFTGEVGRNKKEAEQLAARAVIRSLLVSSGSATVLSEIIKSKVKLYAALNKIKESNHSTENIAGSYVPTAAIPVSSMGMVPTAAITVSSTGMVPTAAIPEASAGMLPIAAAPVTSTEMNQPHYQFKMPKVETSSEHVALPIQFVPPVLGQSSGVGPSTTNNLPIQFVPSLLGQPSGVGPSTTNKRRKNKKKANKKLRTDAQPCIAAQPSTYYPPCSVAQ